MSRKPTYEELKQVAKDLNEESTKRRLVEEELNIVYAALNSAASGVMITDKKGSIKYANPAFLRMFEYEFEKQVTGKCADELFAHQGRRRFIDRGSIIDKSKGQTEIFPALRKDGTIFHVEVSTSSITDNEGHNVGRMASFVDITERKQMEEALKEGSEKIRLFAYSVSHDLKSPAIGLYGLTKRLHKDYSDILNEKGQRYCEQILKTAEQIAALVGQINIFISTKEAPLTVERLELKEVLQVIREEFSSQLSIREIRWSEPDYIPEIKADRLSIIRALRNLVDNALKYGGEALSEINIGHKEFRESHILSVKDNGIGIKEQGYHQDVFGPFIRRKTSKGIEGSGLGLSIVREIAEKHGGEVWLEPGQDRGITFYISIPKYLQLSP
ncbi:MAG: PAS domain-containing sensor histidine kinase [Desulfobacteraceae bacterium]|jgi:PAS domain S-box-containing protein